MGKADTHKMEAHFSVVLVSIPQEGLGETVGAFAEAFHIEAGAAKQVLSTAPIILFRDLAKPEVRAIKPKLLELSRRGAEFRVTPRPAESLPSVAWPTKPGFAQSGGGELLPSVKLEWSQHAFVCPTCGEAFVIRSIGKPALTKHVEAKAPTPTPEPKPAAPPKEEKKAAPPPPQKPPDKKTAAKKVEVVEEIEEIEEISEISEPIEEVEEIEEVTEISDPLEEVEEIEEVSEAETIEEIEEIADVSGDIEMIDLDESPKKSAPVAKKPPAKEEKKAPPKAPPPKAVDKKPAKKDDDDGEISYSVFLSRIPTPDKQVQAAKILAEVRGVPMSEAKDLAARMVIPVIKDVSKEEAEQCLERFKKMKIAGRITKKQ